MNENATEEGTVFGKAAGVAFGVGAAGLGIGATAWGVNSLGKSIAGSIKNEDGLVNQGYQKGKGLINEIAENKKHKKMMKESGGGVPMALKARQDKIRNAKPVSAAEKAGVGDGKVSSRNIPKSKGKANIADIAGIAGEKGVTMTQHAKQTKLRSAHKARKGSGKKAVIGAIAEGAKNLARKGSTKVKGAADQSSRAYQNYINNNNML